MKNKLFDLDALQDQVAGGHYRKMGIQPFEMTLANFGYQGLRAAVYTKVNKYLGRDKGGFDKHIEDIQKAIHCLHIQLEAAKDEQEKSKMDTSEECPNLQDSEGRGKVQFI